MATIWRPNLKNVASGRQKKPNIRTKKVIALQRFLTHYRTIQNDKITTRNEKVACSNHVTSSKKGHPIGVALFGAKEGCDSKIKMQQIGKGYCS